MRCWGLWKIVGRTRCLSSTIRRSRGADIGCLCGGDRESWVMGKGGTGAIREDQVGVDLEGSET